MYLHNIIRRTRKEPIMRITNNSLTVLATLFILMPFVGCTEKEKNNKPEVSLTVEPLVGIGDIKFGDSKDGIIGIFGEPDEIQAQGNELNYVASKGMGLTIDADMGLKRIKLWSENWPQKLLFTVSTFAGKTASDVGMGATREQIVAAYGEPDRTSTPDSQSFTAVIENLHYDKVKTKFTLADGNLVAIILEARE